MGKAVPYSERIIVNHYNKRVTSPADFRVAEISHFFVLAVLDGSLLI